MWMAWFPRPFQRVFWYWPVTLSHVCQIHYGCSYIQRTIRIQTCIRVYNVQCIMIISWSFTYAYYSNSHAPSPHVRISRLISFTISKRGEKWKGPRVERSCILYPVYRGVSTLSVFEYNTTIACIFVYRIPHDITHHALDVHVQCTCIRIRTVALSFVNMHMHTL